MLRIRGGLRPTTETTIHSRCGRVCTYLKVSNTRTSEAVLAE